MDDNEIKIFMLIVWVVVYGNNFDGIENWNGIVSVFLYIDEFVGFGRLVK